VAGNWCPEAVRTDSLLGELKLRLVERLEWWKLEARRYVAEQEAHRARLTDSDHTKEEKQLPRRGLAESGDSRAEPSREPTSVVSGDSGSASASGRGDGCAQSAAEAFVTELKGEAHAWDNIEIRFISDERVQISIGTQRETRNYEEMGFGSKKNGTPVLAWATLRELAQAGGVVHVASGSGKWAEVEKRMQEIRRQLQRLFGLSSDPLPYHELWARPRAWAEKMGPGGVLLVLRKHGVDLP
jgi:hypothetical protein